MNELSGDWFDCRETGDAERVEEELRREIAPRHELAGDDLVCVAYRRHMKETVFWLPQRLGSRPPDVDAGVGPAVASTTLHRTWSEVVAAFAEAE